MAPTEKKLDFTDFSIRKLTSVLQQIDNLKASDFPHIGGEDALGRLQKTLQKNLDRLETIPADADSATKKAACAQINHDIARFLPLLGFILRSTNIRNSFEFFEPLLRTARALLGDDAKLILSSEWDYSPLTYPLAFQELPRFVFVGLPVFEAANSLVIPLAGHELGHSVWNNESISKKIRPELREKIIAEYKNAWGQFRKIFDFSEEDKESLESDMILYSVWSNSFTHALRQSEEIFCDVMGVYIFGASYIRAFEYLLAPYLGAKRSPSYPEMTMRVEMMAKAADAIGIDVPPGFRDAFQKQEFNEDEANKFILKAADKAVEGMFDALVKKATTIAERSNLKPPDAAVSNHIFQRIELGIPAEGSGSLANIIDAAWRVYSDRRFLPTQSLNDEERFQRLNEVVFKTIEVNEIENRLKMNAEGSGA